MNSLKTFFYSIKKSLFNPEYYDEVAKAGFGFSYKYLWFLLFILTFIKSLTFAGSYLKNRPQIQPGISKFMDKAQTIYPGDLELKIINGQLYTNTQEPFFFDLDNRVTADLRRHFLIIDTKGTIENYPNYNTSILATKNAVVYPSKSNNNRIEQTSVFYFRDLKKDVTLNKKIYDNFLNLVKPYTYRALFFIDSFAVSFLLLFLVFGSLFWTGGVMTGLLFLTLIVWVANLIFKKQYSYGSLFKMGMHAVTWSILTSEIFTYLKSPFPRFYSIIFLVWMLLVLFKTKNSLTS